MTRDRSTPEAEPRDATGADRADDRADDATRTIRLADVVGSLDGATANADDVFDYAADVDAAGADAADMDATDMDDTDTDTDAAVLDAADADADLNVGIPPQPSPIDVLARRLDELARLRQHDIDLVDRLHAENSRLRQGELTEAMGPLLRGLIRLHDQMSSLGGDDTQGVAGILRAQLLQTLDLTADVRPYTAVPGMPFDSARHLGVRRIRTEDPALDRTVARTVKPGFVRGETTVVRPAEVEVYRAH